MIRKIVLSLIVFVSLAAQALAGNQNDLLIQGIEKYKNKDYLGAVQTMEAVVKNDPGCGLAYYYMGISHVHLGNAVEAESAYEKVIYLDPNSQLATYAEIGIKQLAPEEKDEPKKNDFIKKIQDNLYSEDLQEDMKKRKLKVIMDKVNSDRKIVPEDIEELEDFSPDKSYNGTPTQEQIAQAYQTLAKAGLNPYQQQAFNPNMMQANMMSSTFGGSNNNSMNNMLPFLMMMQNQQQGTGNQNIDPEFMQTMLSNMMMPDLSNMYDSNNNKNY